MSYFEVVCPKCGQHYWFGVVGTSILGGHDCPKDPKPDTSGTVE